MTLGTLDENPGIFREVARVSWEGLNVFIFGSWIRWEECGRCGETDFSLVFSLCHLAPEGSWEMEKGLGLKELVFFSISMSNFDEGVKNAPDSGRDSLRSQRPLWEGRAENPLV